MHDETSKESTGGTSSTLCGISYVTPRVIRGVNPRGTCDGIPSGHPNGTPQENPGGTPLKIPRASPRGVYGGTLIIIPGGTP